MERIIGSISRCRILGVDLLMIFVTLGTQDKAFPRLIETVVNALPNEEIVIQKGFTKYDNPKYKSFTYVSKEEFQDYIKRAEVVVTHGGVGSIMTALQYDKKVIAVARLAKYKEHQNDHQLDIVNHFSIEGYIMSYQEGDDFKAIFKEIKEKKMAKVRSNNQNFINKLKNYLEL